MQTFEPINEETPIEGYPGFIGYMWDLEEILSCHPALEPLRSFPWIKYIELFDVDEIRKLDLQLSSGCKQICVSEADNLPTIVDQIPSVTVKLDIPNDQGPAGGVAHIFFLAEGSDHEVVARDIDVLVASLRLDYGQLGSR